MSFEDILQSGSFCVSFVINIFLSTTVFEFNKYFYIAEVYRVLSYWFSLAILASTLVYPCDSLLHQARLRTTMGVGWRLHGEP